MTNQQPLEDLKHMRNMMDRSTKFLSLSGLSGIFIGILALISIVYTYHYWDHTKYSDQFFIYFMNDDGSLNTAFLHYFYKLAALLLVSTFIIGFVFTRRRIKMTQQSLNSSPAKRMLTALFIPLISGGVFSLLMVMHRYFDIIPGSMLIFYGLALVNASKYSYTELKFLGLIEILTGLAALYLSIYGLLFWAFGFGVMHIIYGTIMFARYEWRKNP